METVRIDIPERRCTTHDRDVLVTCFWFNAKIDLVTPLPLPAQRVMQLERWLELYTEIMCSLPPGDRVHDA